MDPIQAALEEMIIPPPDIALSVRSTFTFDNATGRLTTAPGLTAMESTAAVDTRISKCGLECVSIAPPRDIQANDSLRSVRLTQAELAHSYAEGASENVQSAVSTLYPYHLTNTVGQLGQIKYPDPEQAIGTGRRGCKSDKEQHTTAVLSDQTINNGFQPDDLQRDYQTPLNRRRCRLSKESLDDQGLTMLHMTWYDCVSAE
ncbi:uncharacterized protein I303_103878 [Kwoniella dejecticola CBS 10117]|uniref:Uncharacterized protein n=1 Tax=Kwoniella dejecticola CBS 10117 TaxID=1296121 RepID=A0A1A6A7Z6_9TREE|nr:uncharacterized protein I303_03897 [Kwoniella dejecticola CBS 10117]OBR86177.1 hypothetical protein I303_03897 [Kwoniella dejecticola CBS 10117]